VKIEEYIKQKLGENGGWLRSKDFNYRSDIYPVLDAMVREGELKKVKQGLYCATNTTYDELSELTHLYPDGVLCLFSAWYHYGLTTTVPYLHHLAFEHKAKPVFLEYPPVKAYFWSEPFYRLGVVNLKGSNIYNLERSVCDAVKFRNKAGEEIMLEVLRNYMKTPQRNITLLLDYALKLRVKNIIEPYLKTMI
jgi:predicted transcriptional regulator of viral defense system